MYKLHFFVPESHLESVKNACFKAGAGKVGPYDQCAWQTLGTGQYRPLENSTPYQGVSGRLETASEYLVDMVIEDAYVKDVLNALIDAHPYETPAYSVWKLLSM